MPNSATHRRGGATRSGRGSAPSGAAGSHRKPGRRKATKPTPSLSVVPALAGVASLVAAASGAVVIQPSSPPLAHAAGNEEASSTKHAQAAHSLTSAAVEQARDSAVDRAGRAQAAEREQAASAERQEQLEAEAEQFEAWEEERSAEINQVKEEADEAVQTQFTLERSGGWSSPLASYRLSARYGQAGGYWSSGYHTGQDFSAPSGSPIAAVGDGEVIEASYDGAYGNQVKLRHEDGTETWYAHMSDFAVSAGEVVVAGDTVGYVGSTGNSTGPHLHLEVHTGDGEAIEPLSWLRQRGIDL